MQKLSAQTLFLAGVVVVGAVAIGYLILSESNGLADNPAARSDAPAARSDGPAARPSKLALKDIPFDGSQAYEYLKEICAIGPRVSGSTGMTRQQKMLTEHFQKAGGKVQRQEFKVRHPNTGAAVEMANLVIQWHPERKERILLCAHYDTRPFPDQDRRNPRGRFIGANDGASGVAVLMELARHMPKFDSLLGVDFVLFDGEELVYKDGDPYFYGSERFATNYVKDPPAHKYRWGVLLDMVGDKDLRLLKEGHSVEWEDTRPLVDDIWQVAASLGVREFVPDVGTKVLDDHTKLHDIGKIPCIDIIDFEYPAWHTEQDVPGNCSALSLGKVGWVVHEWLKRLK